MLNCFQIPTYKLLSGNFFSYITIMFKFCLLRETFLFLKADIFGSKKKLLPPTVKKCPLRLVFDYGPEFGMHNDDYLYNF